MILHQADSVSALSAESRRPEQTHFRPDIEGLRAVAVGAVVLFHAAVPGIGGGYVGVDVFFVISGFLITGLLWREVSNTGSVRLRSFYGARARRLLPASAFVGVVTMIASVILLPPLQAPVAIGDGIASALYVSNFWFIGQNIDYFGGHLSPSPFLHYWSLGVEEQFYLVWAPIFLGAAWLIRRARRKKASSQHPFVVVLALIAAGSFALSLLMTYLVPAAAFYSLPTRAWQLALGGLVALTAQHWHRLPARVAALTGWTGLTAIVLACTTFNAATPYPGIAALLPTLGAVLVIGAGCATSVQGCGRLLAQPPMQAIGRLSYSWYLWHWPVLILVPLALGHPLGLPARITAALASAALAWLTLRYLENPLRFIPAIRESAWRSLALGAAATAIAVCTGLALLHVVPTAVGPGAPATPLAVTIAPVPAGADPAAYDTAVTHAIAQVQAALTASADVNTVPSNLDPPLADVAAEPPRLLSDGCMRTDQQAGQPECATGDTASATTVALVGDSHAAMWNPAFQQLAARRSWRLEMLAKAGCPLLDVPITKHLQSVVEHFRHCEQWRAQILDRLRTEHPRLVLLSVWRGYGSDDSLAGFTPYDREWTAALGRLVRQIRDTGAKVLVLGPVPDPHLVVPVCLSGHLDDVSACTPTRSAAVNETGITAEAAATTAGGGHYADLTDLFCTSQRCPVIVGNTQVYFDDSHLTLGYSTELAPVIRALADRALAGS